MGTIGKILIGIAKGKNLETISANVIENFGIDGDIHSGEGPKQLCIISNEALVSYENKNGMKNGICANKFYANIITSDFLIKKVKINDQLKINNVIIEITKIGKRCFKEEGCLFAKYNNYCELENETVYAKVIKGGEINVGDEIVSI